MVKKKSFGLLILLLIVIMLYFYFLNPSEKKSYFLPCFFYEITGYKCPGCGTQRAFHELLHLRFFEAVKQNALFVILIPYILLIFFTNFNKEKHQNLSQLLLSNKTLIFLLVVAILFGIFRNF